MYKLSCRILDHCCEFEAKEATPKEAKLRVLEHSWECHFSIMEKMTPQEKEAMELYLESMVEVDYMLPPRK